VQVVQLIERLDVPELGYEERLSIAGQLRETLGSVHEHAPPEKLKDIRHIPSTLYCLRLNLHVSTTHCC